MKQVLGILAVLAAQWCFAAKVEIDGNQVLVIDGKKTFLIGFIMPPEAEAKTPWGKNGIQELSDAGATFLRTGVMGKNVKWEDAATWEREQKWQDAAAKYGMHCMIGLRDAGSIDNPQREAMLRKIVSVFKDHPGMGAYYGVDEPQWGKHPIEPMVKAYKLIKELDPDHPVWVNHAPRGKVEELAAYNVTCDATGMDVYPVSYPPGTHSLQPNKQISMVGDYTDMMMQVARGEWEGKANPKPVWMCLQIAWSGVVNPGKTLRFPTLKQERFMTYQSIIKGSRGVIYFGGQLPKSLNERDAKYGWNWTFWEKVLRPVVQEIGSKSPLYPALVGPKSKWAVDCDGASGMEWTTREAGDDFFVIASKREGDAVRAQFQYLPGNLNPEGEVMFEGPRKVKVEGGKFTDWFAPFEVHVYRFKKVGKAATEPVQERE